MKTTQTTCLAILLAVSATLIASPKTFAATTGFNQTAAGPYDYNTTGNWVGGTINGIWDSSLTLAAAQTATFAADTTLTTGLTFNYAGNFALTLDSSTTTAHLLTLGGDISLNTGGGTTANVTIGNASDPLNVDLGGVNRTFTVAASRTLTIVNVISGTGFGITTAGAGTLALSGLNTYSGGTFVNGATLSVAVASTTSAGGANPGPAGAGSITLNDGTLNSAEPNSGGSSFNITIANNIVIGTGSNSIRDDSQKDFGLTGGLSGSGNVTVGNSSTTSTLNINNAANSMTSGTITFANNNNVSRIKTVNFGNANVAWVANNTGNFKTTLEFNSGTISFGSLTGNGQITGNIASQNQIISVGNLGLNDTFSGALVKGNSATLGLIKVGTGAMTLSGAASTYNGTTTVENGSLIAGAAVAVSANSPLGNASSAIALGDATSISGNLSPSLFNGGAFTMARTVTVGANNTATTGIYTLGGNTASSSTFSGAITLNQSLVVTQAASGTLTVSGGITSGASGTQTIMVNNSAPVTIGTGVIGGGTGTIALTENGPSTLTLTGTHSYTGATTVSGGTLLVNGSTVSGSAVSVSGSSSVLGGSGTVNGATTISSSGALTPRPSAGSATTTTFGGNLTITNGASANFTLSTSGVGSNDKVVYGNGGTGTLTLNSSATINITCTTLDQANDYVLFTTNGAGTYTLSMTTTPVLKTNGVTVTPAVNSFVITNYPGSSAVVLHYLQSTTPATVNSQSASPSSIGHHQTTVVTVNVTPSAGNVTNLTVTLDGLAGAGDPVSLTGPGGNGSGNWTGTFTAATSLAAGPYIISGTVKQDNGANIGWSVSVTVTNSGSVWSGSGGDNKWSTVGNWNSNLSPGPGDYVAFAGSTQLTNNLDASLTVGSLTFNSGAGSFDITNAASTLTLAGGLTNNSASAQTLDVPVALSGVPTINAAAGNVTINYPVSDSGTGFTLAGTNTLTLSATNTYNGATTIGSGTLAITGSGSLGSGAYSANITNNGALNYGSSANQTLSGNITGTGSLTNNSSSGSLTLNGTSSTYSGGTTINAGILIAGNATAFGSGSVTLNGGAIRGGVTITNNIVVGSSGGTITTSGAGNFGLTGTLSGAGNLTIGGGAPQNASIQPNFSTNTMTSGTITLNGNPGIVRLQGPASSSAALDWVFNGGGTDASGTYNFGSFSGSGSYNAYNGNNGQTTLYSIGANNHNATFSGAQGQTGTGQILSILKVGNGVQTFSGVNTYTGNTTISAGTLALSGSGSIANSTNLSIAAGATFDVSGLTSTFALGSSQTLAGSGGSLAGNVNLNAGSLVLNYTNGTPSLSVTNGTLSFNSNAVTVTVSGTALGAGSYKLVAKNTGGSVSGTLPVNVNVNGAGATAPVALQMVSGELYLVVGTTTTALVSTENPSGFKDSVTFAASVQTNGVTAGNATGTVTFYTNSVAYATNGLSSGSTNISLFVLPRGTNLITAIYSGDVNYLPSTNSLNQVVTNHPPVAGNMVVTRNAGINSLRITISDLLTNVTDADGDTITLVGVGNSTNGVIVSLSGTNLLNYYNTNNVNDQFSYTVTDGFGGTNSGLVNIVVSNAVTGQVTGQFTSFTNNTAGLTFYGIPNYNYVTERSTNLTDWVDITTNTAATNGVINVTDYFSDLGSNAPSSAYYRLKWQP